MTGKDATTLISWIKGRGKALTPEENEIIANVESDIEKNVPVLTHKSQSLQRIYRRVSG